MVFVTKKELSYFKVTENRYIVIKQIIKYGNRKYSMSR